MLGFTSVEILVLIISAVVIGLDKAGIKCMTAIIPIMALTFGARESTAMILPMLCIADLFAVYVYIKHINWKEVFVLIPPALIGFVIAIFVDKMIPTDQFKFLLGICLLVVLIVMVLFDKFGSKLDFTDKWWFGSLFGILGGFTTMIGNAAGPIMTIYLLSRKKSKNEYLGINVCFFFIINLLKLPIQVFVWKNLGIEEFITAACMIPAIAVGVFIGKKLIDIMPEKFFKNFVLLITLISIIMLLI